MEEQLFTNDNERVLERILNFNLKLLLRENDLSQYDYRKAQDLDIKGWKSLIDKAVLSKYEKVKNELSEIDNNFFNVYVLNNKQFIDWLSNTKVSFGYYKHKKSRSSFIRDNAIQNEILTDLDLYRKLKKLVRYKKFCLIGKEDCFSLDERNELNALMIELGNKYIEQAKHLFDRNRCVLYKARKRIKQMLDSDCKCLFMTFTNSDLYLSNSSVDGRLTYVRRLLKKYAVDYMLNTDYGKENGREHFHCVACFRSKRDYKALCDAYKHHTNSAIRNRHFGKGNSDIFKGAKYISALTTEKLAFHCVKDTARRVRLVYCSQPDYKRIECVLN